MILDDMLNIMKNKKDNIAYSINENEYTYGELYKYVCNIYNYFNLNNIQKKPIIVYGHKEIYMKATFLAASFAGITYVPVDRCMSENRIKDIISEVNPFCIVGDCYCNGYLNINEENILKIMNREIESEIEKIYLSPEDIYYMLFTSGTTGKPKGVQITYKNINECIYWIKDIMDAKEEIILNQVIYSFDVSCMDLYVSTITGSEQYILNDINIANITNTYKELKKSNATKAVMTPSYIELLLLDDNFNGKILPNLNQIVFCGEKLNVNTVRKIFEKFPNVKITNTYGPTECTVAVTSIDIKPQDNWNEIPIGKAKEGVEILIIDEKKKEVEEGKKGEILILGNSVGLGYLNFKKEDTFIEYEGKKGYLTGDIGYIENGNIYYVDRKDRQVKYRGYRIELSDIEKNILKIKYVEKVKVLAKKDGDGKVIGIIAYIQVKENSDKLNIKKDLKNKIPKYMIPRIKIINEFPLNNNGKVNIEQLRRM